ncbi:MAG TPA: glycosyltransferase family 4 protein [Opitutaceae bacterium]
MKVAYVYQHDAANRSVQSGRPASILRNLEAQGAVVERIFPLDARMSRGSTLKKALSRLVGRYYRGDREPRYLSAVAAEFNRRTKGVAFDIAFSPGSEAVSYLDIPQPVAFCADATFANMVDYYWDFSSLSAEYVRKGNLQETAALNRAALAIYPSEWAARSAIDFYHADPGKVFVVPFGANLGSENRREQVETWIAARRFDVLRLLFVGRSWRRKDGDLVVATAQRLVAKGVRVKLDVVSGDVPHQLGSMPWVTHHGLLDPNKPASAAVLADLFRAANFVFIPSRAEAYGMVFAEASAFGVPAIGTATGGIPSALRDGVNGFTLPMSAGAQDYAELIARAIANRDQYYALCRSSFDEFERRLNWKVFCARFLDLAQQCCENVAPKAEGIA